LSSPDGGNFSAPGAGHFLSGGNGAAGQSGFCKFRQFPFSQPPAFRETRQNHDLLQLPIALLKIQHYNINIQIPLFRGQVPFSVPPLHNGGFS
jgi:hypothetical protein